MLATTLIAGLSAGSAGLAGYALSRLALDATDGDRRRLKSRLLREDDTKRKRAFDFDGVETAHRSIRKDEEPEGWEGRLAKFPVFRSARTLILQSKPDLKLTRFVGLTAAITFGCLVVFFAFTGSLLVAAVSATLGACGPSMWLMRLRNDRQRAIGDQLPDALDFLGRSLRAGHSLSTGLHMMSQELQEPTAGEFGVAYGQHSLGVPMETALKSMTERIDSTDFAFFVTAVLIQRQTGGDLSMVLNNIGGMIRQRIRLQQSVRAKTAEGRFTGYLLTAFPAVMFVLMYCLNAEYAGKLTNTPLGVKLLCGAFFFQVLGLFVIRRLTVVKV